MKGFLAGLLLLLPLVPARAEVPRYVVSILPLQGVVSELAGSDREVEVLVGPGATPAMYEPTARQMVALSGARALFVIGVPFENTFLPRVRRQLPDLRIVDAAAGIPTRFLAEGHGHDDHHHETDPHVWTDPLAMLTVVDNVATALAEVEPSRAQSIDSRRQDLRDHFLALHQELERSLQDVTPRVIAVFHPAFGHFADRYGFRQVAVESGGVEPGARHLVELAGQLEDLGVDRVFVQPQFSPQRAETLASVLDVEVVPIDPLSPDVAGMLRRFARELGADLGEARR